MLSVAQLMHNHTVEHFPGSEHQQTVEIQVSLAGAAAPAGPLTADGDPPVSDIQPAGVIGNPVRNERFCLMCQETDFRVGQQRNMLLCFLPGPGFCKMTFNPGLLFLKKTGDLCIGNTQGARTSTCSCRISMQSVFRRLRMISTFSIGLLQINPLNTQDFSVLQEQLCHRNTSAETGEAAASGIQPQAAVDGIFLPAMAVSVNHSLNPFRFRGTSYRSWVITKFTPAMVKRSTPARSCRPGCQMSLLPRTA